ncbi:PREDICTED: protein couch potato-like [Ceratosolen solmsi marchali]|uniref:Protein couch potato-like n=1 Tax=Ceratosolen solmsi marchali TaxID=326594 RepID=A0AAJ6YM78_9HYME|nr:PREDICTED: protein couch potato-like [Ceratosolen solmsi marchali]
MLMLSWLSIVIMILVDARVEGLTNGVKHTNVLGGLEQHASFSFVRPGLTQTAFAFNGPSSHQSFSSSVGDPYLVNKALPGVAHALAYRNPGLDLGFAPVHHGPVAPTYNIGSPAPAIYPSQPLDYQQQQALALAYQHQLQQYHQYQQQQQPVFSEYIQQLQGQQINADIQENVQHPHHSRLLPVRYTPNTPLAGDSIPEQLQLQLQHQHQHQQHQQQQVQSQPQQPRRNLLGIAYSSSPSVAHVKVSGNGYKIHF